MTADVKPITTSKESFATQILQSSDEITAINVNMNNELKLEMKQKILSQENEDDNKRWEELSKLIENSVVEEKSTLPCLKDYITTNESSTKDSKKQILKQSDENSVISLKLKTDSDSGNKIKRVSKEH